MIIRSAGKVKRDDKTEQRLLSKEQEKKRDMTEINGFARKVKRYMTELKRCHYEICKKRKEL